MKITKLILISLLSLSSVFSIIPQTVSTLVPGTSTFNDGLALDKDGNIYASYYYSTTVTKITPEGITSIFAGGFSDPNGLTFDKSGLLYVPSARANRIDVVTPEGQVSQFLNITNPGALLFDREGNMYIASYNVNRISILDTAGNVTSFWSGGVLNGPIGLVFDENGNLYVGNFNDGKIFKRTQNGDITEIGDIPGWMGFMTKAGSNIYATAFQQHKIYKVPMDGSGQSVFAGTGAAGQNDGPVIQATFSSPNGIIATTTGDTLYISDFTPRSLRMITGVNSITAADDEKIVIFDFKLHQNYPNPFNPTTSIQYTVSNAGFISLKIYDVLGKEVSSLVNEYKSAGNYKINFDASSLASGVYLYKLKSGNFVDVKKMLLLK
ncbi:MAG: hypothetical protein BMS9Abin39_0870 [Ignavibacteria bacterium]|nr:MAG: hypothetical protein BMS9Abin39_0870 [Ignavibacteria bacterium]